MKITKHAQSCFILTSGDTRLIIDPGRFLLEKENLDAKKLGDFDALLITHRHSDHMDPGVIDNIMHNSKKPIKILINSESFESLKSELNLSKESISVVKGDEVFDVGDFRIETKVSKHGLPPNGTPAPETTGFLVSDNSITIYHPGDTIDLPKGLKADVMLVPITGCVTFDPKEARTMLGTLRPKIAIPIHNDSTDHGYYDRTAEFKKLMVSEKNIRIIYMQNGEGVEV